MCGIAVAVNCDDAEAIVRRLLKGVVHRGDLDDPVVVPRPRIAMGTRRLRIVDAERAAQPQASFDGRILVSFNGEIYNHVELRRALEAKGVAFRTESDTEVLASGLRIFGPKLLEQLNGMYAFVALDTANGEFLAARDPFGVKPLYLVQSGAGAAFCSEIRPLLAATEEGGAMLLPPGHLLTRRALLRFATAPGGEAKPRIAHDPEALDGLLAAAVHARLPPDLPSALMFSGGVDSTLVAHYARQIRPDVPGYFLGDDGAPDHRYAALYAEKTGFDLRRVPFDHDADVDSRIAQVVAAAETFEPSVIRDGLCTYLVSRRIAADGYRVALSGEGADELFAGYTPLELAFSAGDEVGGFVRDQCLLDMHRTNLQRLDRCSMRFGLEAREPFLDRAVADYALGLGAEDMIRTVNGAPQGKAALRSLWALHPELPEAIRDRAKSPLHVGSGFDRSQKASPWIDFAEETVTDGEFAEGRKRFARFDLRSKEELLYLMKLAECFDVFRVPHLTARPRLRFPAEKLEAAAKARLSDFLVEA